MRDHHLVPLLGAEEKQTPAEQPWKDILLERHMVSPGEIPEHEHPDLCLQPQVAGDADFEWWSAKGNDVARTAPGSLILIPAGTRDRLLWRGRSERLIVSVDQRSLARFAEEISPKWIPQFKADWSLRDRGLQQLVREMGEQARRQWPLGGLYADLLAMGLKSHLLQKHTANPMAGPALQAGLSLRKLKHSMEFMNANLANDVRLESIAKEVGASSSHFAHEFRKSTGQTPYQYLLEQRMDKARHLLRTTKLTVLAVGGLTGFGFPANFVRTFRQRIGTTPEAWRKAGHTG